MEGESGSLIGWVQDSELDRDGWNGSALALCLAGELHTL